MFKSVVLGRAPKDCRVWWLRNKDFGFTGFWVQGFGDEVLEFGSWIFGQALQRASILEVLALLYRLDVYMSGI